MASDNCGTKKRSGTNPGLIGMSPEEWSHSYQRLKWPPITVGPLIESEGVIPRLSVASDNRGTKKKSGIFF